MDDDLKQSPLHDEHLKLGARMVPFAGWQMPVQYEGIMPEHKAVRSSLGVFDISHMGQLFVRCATPDVACRWLDGLLTNNVAKLEPGDGQYTVLLNDRGGVIDDLIIYRENATDYFLVVNASKVDEDFAWMQAHLSNAEIAFTNQSSEFAAMAVQGPKAAESFVALFGADATLPARFCMGAITTDAGDVIICRTGYTGEDGYELFCPADMGPAWWRRCLDAGAAPTGLGARDSLRLEKCYPLNGNDLSPDHTPLEAGLGFAVDLNKSAFIGRDVLVQQKADGLPQRLVALKQLGKSAPPRPGYAVFFGDLQVGTLCSGGVSPTLGFGVSLAYIPAGHNQIGTPLEVEIRGKRFPAEVVKKPFV
jgi:aminomethyltransferase